jgi:hypothetical protein
VHGDFASIATTRATSLTTSSSSSNSISTATRQPSQQAPTASTAAAAAAAAPKSLRPETVAALAADAAADAAALDAAGSAEGSLLMLLRWMWGAWRAGLLPQAPQVGLYHPRIMSDVMLQLLLYNTLWLWGTRGRAAAAGTSGEVLQLVGKLLNRIPACRLGHHCRWFEPIQLSTMLVMHSHSQSCTSSITNCGRFYACAGLHLRVDVCEPPGLVDLLCATRSAQFSK